ncbi:hypothetical protein KAFR_0I02470 [Kazachstania africana CBS 2517]|uniref:D-lactate dehydratase n=1 Tax=Kazachstania africana (strain ATCC 22294 / BCRC 22015 / CBS 2517 / CECT 1963 / NBRC 1671 / NRRL Y-8276) TaxID=1071382 RepID=H2B076_KAZAF|nr:hypothetical protein KAFR_0I02470 [Kazachstania africana CBS 2517]CCF60026.1 hypothetical protein KAFR_0I02470 [Kazachstania africana CBS 2517]
MVANKRALIALTSYHGPLYADGSKTGVFFVEALHPFKNYRARGYEVDFVSETGTFGWDDHSLTEDFLNGQDKKDYETKDSDLYKALAKVKKPSEINAADYSIFFASAGHGTLFDYPTAKGLQSLAADIYDKGGIVAAVCHGPAIFDGLNDKKTGKNILNGKAITGFTDIGETMLGVDTIMKEMNLLSVEDIAKKYNVKFLSPIGPWDDYSITDDRIITGVNPASAGSTATRSMDALEKQMN